MLDFEFTTQDEETVSLEDLKGEWWITYMFYTDCRTVCPQTTANMVEIQADLEESGLKPQIISFSVDPENDTPDELRQYADDYGANLDTWEDRKSTRLNSSHVAISYAVFCLKKK